MSYKFQPPQDDSSIVPFGKYRGQPVEVMMADRSYLDWMLGQPGMVTLLQGKYPALFNIITIGAPASDDSPAHNELQAKFLDPEFQLAFLEVRLGQSVYAIAVKLAEDATAKAAEILAEAVSVARQDDINSTEALEELQKTDAEIKGSDWKEHYRKERSEYLEKQREEERKIREDAALPRQPWSSRNSEPIRHYDKPFPSYESWSVAEYCGFHLADDCSDWRSDWSSWPNVVKRHNKEMEHAVAQQIKDREVYQAIASIRIQPPEPARPVVTFEFECGFDVLIKFNWCSEIYAPWLKNDYFRKDPGQHSYDRYTRGDWFESSNRDEHSRRLSNVRTDEFRIEIKPQIGDDFPSVLRQMKRNNADTLVIGAFESLVCTLDQVRQIFGEKRILTFSEIEAVQERGVWAQSD